MQGGEYEAVTPSMSSAWRTSVSISTREVDVDARTMILPLKLSTTSR